MRGVRLRRRIYGSFIEALDPSGQNKQCSEKRQVYLQSKKSFGGLGPLGTVFSGKLRAVAYVYYTTFEENWRRKSTLKGNKQ